MTSINLPQDVVQAVVSKAILDTLDQQTRDTLIKDAIKYLLTPTNKAGIYGENISPLTEAFRLAVRHVAEDLVRKEAEGNADLQAQIRAAIHEAAERVFNGDGREKLVENMATAIERAFRLERY